MIKPTQIYNAISIIDEVPTEGHSPLLIIADDFNEYYIKSTRGQRPPFYIINEIVCHHLLKCWGIPVPEIAFIKLGQDLLANKKSLSGFHKMHFYEDLTFGSKRISPSIEMTEFVNTKKASDYNKLLNPYDLIKVGLFDIWVENTDRKPSNFNILLCQKDSKIEVTAIDNAFTFDSMNYKNLDLSYIVNTYNDNILESQAVKNIILRFRNEKQWCDKIKEYLYICIERCKKHFSEIVNDVPGEFGLNNELVAYLHDFLFDNERNKNVYHELIARIK